MSFKYIRLLLMGPLFIVLGVMLMIGSAAIAAPDGDAAAAQAAASNWRAWAAIAGGIGLSVWALIDIIRTPREKEGKPENE